MRREHDALIGVTALARNMTLVTDDVGAGLGPPAESKMRHLCNEREWRDDDEP